MKVISAKDYGSRKVIRVCLNPDDPEYVGQDGTTAKADGSSWSNEAGAKYNRDVREYTWTGAEMYKTTPKGQHRFKTDGELLNEIKERLQPPDAPSDILPLVGREIGK